jgi:glycosyltransferase involved in cell wall biosynthesis/SAM-dependent methyltransferase
MQKPPLAIFSPLPPSRSGIADYCLEQLRPLSVDWDISVIIDNDAPDPVDTTAEVRVLRRKEWVAGSLATAPVARLYHCGNNPHHDFVLDESLSRPGVVVLHDYVMRHLVRFLTLGQGNVDAYRQFVEPELGSDTDTLIEHDRLGLLTENALYGVPLNSRLLSAAAGVIVHSRASLDRIRDRFPGLPAVHVPHHYSPPPVDVGCRGEARAALGIPHDRIVIASLGFVTPPKQVPLAIEAVGRLASEHPSLDFAVVGEAKNPEQLFDLAAAHGLSDRLRYTGYLSTEDFYRYVAASDVIVNLRYPSAGETSGTLIRAMGMGRCAIVFDYESFGEHPRGTVIKVPLDTDSSRYLEEALRCVLSCPAKRESIAEAAAAHVRTVCHLDACAATYTTLLRAIVPGSRPVTAGYLANSTALDLRDPAWSADEAAGRIERLISLIDVDEVGSDSVAYARVHARRWAETLAMLPAAGPGMAALEIGSYDVILPYLRHELGFARVVGTFHDPSRSGAEEIVRQMAGPGGKNSYTLFRVDVENDRFPFPARSFDLVLACEVIEHLTMDPMFMMSEINRVLKPNGVLVLTTPNITSARGVAAMLAGYAPYLYANFNRSRSVDRHNIEYSPHVIAAVLRASGFGDVTLRTPDCWSNRPADVMNLLQSGGHPVHLRGDMILAAGRKRTEIIDRYPPEVYGGGPAVRRMSTWGPCQSAVPGA